VATSVFNFARTTWGERRTAASANAGAIMRHGPHQGAQKSTRTGTCVRAINFAKDLSDKSIGCVGSNCCLHLPQMGLSVSFASSTRFTARHLEQTRFTVWTLLNRWTGLENLGDFCEHNSALLRIDHVFVLSQSGSERLLPRHPYV
jgi:hypothetical protein